MREISNLIAKEQYKLAGQLCEVTGESFPDWFSEVYKHTLIKNGPEQGLDPHNILSNGDQYEPDLEVWDTLSLTPEKWKELQETMDSKNPLEEIMKKRREHEKKVRSDFADEHGIPDPDSGSPAWIDEDEAEMEGCECEDEEMEGMQTEYIAQFTADLKRIMAQDGEAKSDMASKDWDWEGLDELLSDIDTGTMIFDLQAAKKAQETGSKAVEGVEIDRMIDTVKKIQAVQDNSGDINFAEAHSKIAAVLRGPR